MRVALVLTGHFRTFEQTHTYWRNALEGCEYDVFCSTWDTINSNTISWHTHQPTHTPNYLTDHQIDLLRSFDPYVQIGRQEYTQEEINDVQLDCTSKANIYRYEAICNTLKRIDPMKYDIIIVGRYDLCINGIRFKDIDIQEDEIQCSGIYCGEKFVRKYSNTDNLYMFHPIKKGVFENLFQIYENAKHKNIKYPEEVFTELFYTFFSKVTIKWDTFNISRV